ncbi:hypothetical protein ACFL0E_00725 [Nanoarchaeota archaeon]
MEWSKYLLRCWELAKNSDCQKMKFGSVIVLDDKMIGEGYNHAASYLLKDSCCLREGVKSGTKSELCNAVHAEQAAMINSHHHGQDDLSMTTLYVAGIFPDGKRLIKEEPGLYCSTCARLIAEEGINEIVVPTKQGEAKLSLGNVLGTAYQFATGVKEIKYGKDSE